MASFYLILITVTLAALAVIGILYWALSVYNYAPALLREKLDEALGGEEPDIIALEPVRHAAAGIAFDKGVIGIVTSLNHIRQHTVADLYGIELFFNDKLAARAFKSGETKHLDDILPTVKRVSMRLAFEDPAEPDFELDLWLPTDYWTSMAEGPRVAVQTARRWYYHVEAILRRQQGASTVTAAAAPEPLAPADPSPPVQGV